MGGTGSGGGGPSVSSAAGGGSGFAGVAFFLGIGTGERLSRPT